MDINSLVVPVFVDMEIWNMFFNHRKAMKKPLNGNSCKLIFEKLQALHRQGQDVNECLKNSVMNGWQGVFPTQQQKFTGKAEKTGFIEKHTSIEWAEGL